MKENWFNKELKDRFNQMDHPYNVEEEWKRLEQKRKRKSRGFLYWLLPLVWITFIAIITINNRDVFTDPASIEEAASMVNQEKTNSGSTDVVVRNEITSGPAKEDKQNGKEDETFKQANNPNTFAQAKDQSKNNIEANENNSTATTELEKIIEASEDEIIFAEAQKISNKEIKARNSVNEESEISTIGQGETNELPSYEEISEGQSENTMTPRVLVEESDDQAIKEELKESKTTEETNATQKEELVIDTHQSQPIDPNIVDGTQELAIDQLGQEESIEKDIKDTSSSASVFISYGIANAFRSPNGSAETSNPISTDRKEGEEMLESQLIQLGMSKKIGAHWQASASLFASQYVSRYEDEYSVLTPIDVPNQITTIDLSGSQPQEQTGVAQGTKKENVKRIRYQRYQDMGLTLGIRRAFNIKDDWKIFLGQELLGSFYSKALGESLLDANTGELGPLSSFGYRTGWQMQGLTTFGIEKQLNQNWAVSVAGIGLYDLNNRIVNRLTSDRFQSLGAKVTLSRKL